MLHSVAQRSRVHDQFLLEGSLHLVSRLNKGVLGTVTASKVLLALLKGLVIEFHYPASTMRPLSCGLC